MPPTRLDRLSENGLYHVYTFLSIRHVLAAEISRQHYSTIAAPRYYRRYCRDCEFKGHSLGMDLHVGLPMFGEYVTVLTIHFEYCRTREEFADRHNAINRYCPNLQELALGYVDMSVFAVDNMQFKKGLIHLDMGRYMTADYYIQEYIIANKATLESFTVDFGRYTRMDAFDSDLLANNKITNFKLTVTFGRFKRFVTLFDKIEIIELWRCHAINYAVLEELAELPNLRHAIFRHCPMRAHDIESFVKASKSLERLDIFYCGFAKNIAGRVNEINPRIDVQWQENIS